MANSKAQSGLRGRGRRRVAVDLMYKTAEEDRVDVVIMAEPNKKRVTQSDWLVGHRIDVAIRICNNHMKVVEKGRANGFL